MFYRVMTREHRKTVESEDALCYHSVWITLNYLRLRAEDYDESVSEKPAETPLNREGET